MLHISGRAEASRWHQPLDNICALSLSRRRTCSRPGSAPPAPSASGLHYPGGSAALSAAPSPPRWLAEPVALALLLLLCLPTVRAAVVVAWCQPTPTREEDIPLLLLRPRAASNLPVLFSSPVPLASAPCQSTRLRYQPELSSNSSETSGRRRVLDSPVPPPARLGALLWKLAESQSSFVF